jgi:hypothetical protein
VVLRLSTISFKRSFFAPGKAYPSYGRHLNFLPGFIESAGMWLRIDDGSSLKNVPLIQS